MIIVKFPLLKHEEIDVCTALEFLFVEIGNSIDCFLSFTLLDDINVAGLLEVGGQGAA
jgi:hypothetical protein